MLKHVFFGLFGIVFFVSASLSAQQLQIKLWLNTSGEYLEHFDEEELAEEGWRKTNEDEDESGLIFEKNETITQLPWSESKGNFSISISKEGEVAINFYAGDYDNTANAKTQLPMKAGKVLKSDKSYFLNLNGGEHASGMWEADAKLEVEVLE